MLPITGDTNATVLSGTQHWGSQGLGRAAAISLLLGRGMRMPSLPRMPEQNAPHSVKEVLP